MPLKQAWLSEAAVMIAWFRWWERIPEPRWVNLITGAGYLTFFLGGIATLLMPPRSIVGAAGDTAMTLVGLFFLIGGIVGMTAGTADFWQLERVGIAAMGIGVLTYGYIITHLQFTEAGSRLTQLSMVTVAACFLLLRLAMIWRYDYKPRG